MLRLATADDPDVLCVQEVPAWALDRFTAGDVAARPAFGPLPITIELGRRLTEPNPGLFRSAFSGQGNAMLVSPRLRVLSHHVLMLNSQRFRRAQARALGLGLIVRLGWAKERRIVQALRLEAPEGRTYLVTNMHCTSFAADERLADAEVLRAAWFAVSTAAPRPASCGGGPTTSASTKRACCRIMRRWSSRSRELAAAAHPVPRAPGDGVPERWDVRAALARDARC